MRRLLVTVALCAGTAALAPVSALGLANETFFKTPYGKIVCIWVEEGLSFQDDVVCEVTTGLRPPIPKSGPGCRHERYVGNEVAVRATGPAILIACVAGRGPFANPIQMSVLPYGKSRRGGGLVCSEATTGLTCRNSSGHGFFLSPRRWRTF